MKTNYLIVALVLVGGAIFYFSSNYSRSTGKAYMIYPNKKHRLSQVELWGPAGYYYIDFSTSSDFDDKTVKVDGKGRVQFGTFGSTRWRNNHLHLNDFERNKVNQMMEKMTLETPYLIWEHAYKKGRTPKRHYLIFTERPELYNQDEELLKLAQKAIKPS
ncbi:MAG TPA: hypothetical protein DCS93_15875 [Microscillaceae bacterium]|nr:hypothetical protein [Microscillaceae bacterium]